MASNCPDCSVLRTVLLLFGVLVICYAYVLIRHA